MKANFENVQFSSNTICAWDSPARLSEDAAWAALYEHVKLESNEIFSQSQDAQSDAVEVYDRTANADDFARQTGPVRVTFVDEDIVSEETTVEALKEKSKEIDVREIEQVRQECKSGSLPVGNRGSGHWQVWPNS